MSETARDLLKRGVPWRAGIAWQLVAIEGVVILGIGIYMVVAANDARDIVRQLIAAVLLIHSAGLVLNAIRNRAHPMAVFQALRGGAGLAVGIIVALAQWGDYLPEDAARYILGVGLITYGGIGVIEAVIAARGEPDLRVSSLVTAVVTILLGVLLLTGGAETGEGRIRVLGSVAIIAGLLLIAYAAWIRRNGSQTIVSVESTA